MFDRVPAIAALLGLVTFGCGSSTSPAHDGGPDADAPHEASPDVVGNTTADVVADLGLGADTRVDAGSDAPETGPQNACLFKASYTFHDDGGLRAFVDTSTLTPPRAHTLTRAGGRAGAAGACARDVPCAAPTAVTVSAIEAAVADADVQAALAKPKGMLYGGDPRPVDGTVFVFERQDGNDGRDFTVGSGAVPAGLRALEVLLHQLATETLAAPECAALAP